MALSCYLAECSGVTKYKDTAVLSANCVKTWMLDPATMLIKQCLINATTAEEVPGATLSSYLTGIAIEGFTVLSRVTGDESWGSLAIDMAVAAMKYDGWHDSNGILTVGCEWDASVNTDDKAFKGLLNRGLLVAYQRNRSNKHFCALVRSYINVQCNALLEMSCFRSSYGPDWRGPYVGPYIHAQMAAIDTLIAALGVDD
ncbi:hypothetical protein FRC02_006435 [Tulasnella sp. 418]|nr:hypothetical protein FRC02_006435 [Tulasnella sp. 418]